MESWIDAVGNVHGMVNGSDPSLGAILIGSHYDTVLDAGKYDGPLGIIAGIAAVKTIINSTKTAKLPSGQTLFDAGAIKRTLRVVAFSDEEGVRFQSTFLGSRAIAGTFIKNNLLDAKDKAGISLSEALLNEGYLTPATNLESALAGATIDPTEIDEYVEFHIEQGIALEGFDQPLGVVSAIVGQTRLKVAVHGTQGHAGSVPMKGRADSLAAASDLVLMIERRCGGGPTSDDGKGEGVIPTQGDEKLVCTVGSLEIWPGASNVIAGSTSLTIDVRCKRDRVRDEVVANLTRSIEEVCLRRGVNCTVDRSHDAEAVISDPFIISGLKEAIKKTRQVLASVVGCDGNHETCGWTDPEAEVPELVSGAGHDAMAVSEVIRQAMVFVRCKAGVSHSPLEAITKPDLFATTATLLNYLLSKTT